jgi:hypothetical protein
MLLEKQNNYTENLTHYQTWPAWAYSAVPVAA